MAEPRSFSPWRFRLLELLTLVAIVGATIAAYRVHTFKSIFMIGAFVATGAIAGVIGLWQGDARRGPWLAYAAFTFAYLVALYALPMSFGIVQWEPSIRIGLYLGVATWLTSRILCSRLDRQAT